MSFSAKVSETPQSLLADQKELGARLLLTIPYGISVEKMQGFISVMGGGESRDSLPVLTLCVQTPTAGAIVSTIVFNSDSHYLEFIDKLMADAYLNFSTSNSQNN